MENFQRERSVHAYIYAGLAVIIALLLFRGCGEEEEFTSSPTVVTVTETATPAPEPTSEPTPTAQPEEEVLTPGERAGQQARETVDELKQWGEDFLKGYKNQP